VTNSIPTGLWKLGKLNHLAVAVPDLGLFNLTAKESNDDPSVSEAASSFYKNILQATSVSEAVPLKEHGVYTVFVDLGNTKIEVQMGLEIDDSFHVFFSCCIRWETKVPLKTSWKRINPVEFIIFVLKCVERIISFASKKRCIPHLGG
jgi:hypothetical protein